MRAKRQATKGSPCLPSKTSLDLELQEGEGLLFCHSRQSETGRVRSEYPHGEGPGFRKLVNVSVATAGLGAE